MVNKRRMRGKRIMGAMLSLVMIAGSFPGVSVYAETKAVRGQSETVADGSVLNLTEEGNLDWIHFSKEGIDDRKSGMEGQEIIGFERTFLDKELSEMGDSKLSYAWTDGTKKETENGSRVGTVFASGGVVPEGPTPEGVEIGFNITIPEDDSDRVLTFSPGVWNAAGTVEVFDGQERVYDESFETGGDAIVKKFQVEIDAGHGADVKVRQTSKSHGDGNLSLGAIALKSVDTAVDSEMIKFVQDVRGGDNMNLTEEGNLDWIHMSTKGHERKDGASVIQIENLKDGDMRQVSDSKLSYSWTDGANGSQAEASRGAVCYVDTSGNPGDKEVGFRIQIPTANTTRMLAFAPGIWQGKALLTASNGAGGTYQEILETGGDAKVKKYYFVIKPGQAFDVTVKLTEKSHGDGNVSLGGIALKEQSGQACYTELLEMLLDEAGLLDLTACDMDAVDKLEKVMEKAETAIKDSADEDVLKTIFAELQEAYKECAASAGSGSLLYEKYSGLTSSFGWEGDKHAPISYIDGTYKLRDRRDMIVSFGVKDITGKVKWYNAEGYLPCFVSEYTKNDMRYKVENFANKHTIGGNDYEIAYSRMTVKNTSETEQILPKVSKELIPLNEEAKTARRIQPGETVVRDYAIGADRFDGKYEYPEDQAIADQGGFDENYDEMKTYWNKRLEPLSTIVELPDEQLINAYKAGYIYTLIIRDDYIQEDGSVKKEIHVGENGYDIMFDHDTIGIVATLLTMGDFTYAKDYLKTLPAQLQYDDAKWKYSWPYALYLQKTGDTQFIIDNFEAIKTNSHKIESDRDSSAGGIMKRTNAIDSNGYWLIDNWSALTGLSTYRFLCTQMYDLTGEEEYKTEAEWAEKLYPDLLNSVETKQRQMRETYNYPYLSIDMNVPTELSARSDAQDGNWASMFLFGRWAWDGYLFGAEQQDSEMVGLIDTTYQHGFERRENYGKEHFNPFVGDTIYNFGGYPHGYYSSAYNAGYASAALRGEDYRDAGIKAYQFMIENSMSGPFGWWEGINYPDANSPWDIASAPGGGGSCQHMWGQSVNTKILYDSLISEKIGDKIIIGRGIPAEWIADGQKVEIQDYSVEGGKKTGYQMSTSGDEISIAFGGDTLDTPFSVELIALRDNIKKVVADGVVLKDGIDVQEGNVLLPAGTKNVTITMGGELESADKTELEKLLGEAKAIDQENYTDETARALAKAIEAAEAVMGNEDLTEEDQKLVDDTYDALKAAIDALEEKQASEDPKKADKTELEKLLKKAESMDLKGYTDKSVSALTAAIGEARKVLADESLTEKDQKLVDEAYDALKAAIDGLKKKDPVSPTKPADNNGKKPGKSPKTGDNSPLEIYLVLTGLAGIFVITGLSKMRKRKRMN